MSVAFCRYTVVVIERWFERVQIFVLFGWHWFEDTLFWFAEMAEVTKLKNSGWAHRIHANQLMKSMVYYKT